MLPLPHGARRGRSSLRASLLFATLIVRHPSCRRSSWVAAGRVPPAGRASRTSSRWRRLWWSRSRSRRRWPDPALARPGRAPRVAAGPLVARGFDRTAPGARRSVRRRVGVAVVLLLSGLVALPSAGDRDAVRPPPGSGRCWSSGTAAGDVAARDQPDHLGPVSRNSGTFPGVRHVGAHVGRAVMSDQVVNVNTASVAEPGPLRGLRGHRRLRGAGHRELPGSSDDVLTYPEDRVTDLLRERTTTSSCASTGRGNRPTGQGGGGPQPSVEHRRRRAPR